MWERHVIGPRVRGALRRLFLEPFRVRLPKYGNRADGAGKRAPPRPDLVANNNRYATR